MYEFSPRSEPVASVLSANERGPARVSGVKAVSPVGGQADSGAQGDPQLTERSTATANYAKLQANIANVIAKLDPPRANGGQLAQEAEQSLMALMPQPVIVLPLPPTDQHIVEFVAQVAQSVASQAAMARAAHAGISPALVEAAAR